MGTHEIDGKIRVIPNMLAKPEGKRTNRAPTSKKLTKAAQAGDTQAQAKLRKKKPEWEQKKKDLHTKPQNKRNYNMPSLDDANTRPIRADEAKWGGNQYYNFKTEVLKMSDSQRMKWLCQLFASCYTVNKKGCWVWTHKTHSGKLSLNGGRPRFGPAKLAPEPFNTVHATRFIYLATYPWMAEAIGRANVRRHPTCHEYCVNPEHMRPQPLPKPRQNKKRAATATD